MKHSCNSHLGIKMDSNKHGAMEQNEEDILTNILIYHTRKTELRMMRYGMKKSATGYKIKDLEEKTRVNPSGSGSEKKPRGRPHFFLSLHYFLAHFTMPYLIIRSSVLRCDMSNCSLGGPLHFVRLHHACLSPSWCLKCCCKSAS